MSEFIVKIEEDIVQALGKHTIEQHLQKFITQTILKAAANDILQDYTATDVTQDTNWHLAQKKALQNDKYYDMIKVYANV